MVEKTTPSVETEEWNDVFEGTVEQIKLEKPNESFVGTYLGSDEMMVSDPYGGETRKALTHNFADPDGVRCYLWGSMNLDIGLRSVKPGMVTKVTFLGWDDLGDGRTAKLYKIQTRRSGRQRRN